MRYQIKRRSYAGLKTIAQWVAIFIAFAVIPAVGLDQWISREAALLRPNQAELSNSVVIDGITYDKHGRKQ